MYFVFIKDRESEKWYYSGATKSYFTKEYPTPHSKKMKTVTRYEKYISPKPENVSSFIKEHTIIEADTKEEAWAKLSSR